MKNEAFQPCSPKLRQSPIGLSLKGKLLLLPGLVLNRASSARAQNRVISRKSRSTRSNVIKRVPQRSQPPSTLLHHPPHSLTLLYLKSTSSPSIQRVLVCIQFYIHKIHPRKITCSRCRSYLSWASTSSTIQPSSATRTSSRSPLNVWSLCRRVCSLASRMTYRRY
jgi:hypothetical protein